MTTRLPDTVPIILPGITADEHDWHLWGNALYHNEQERVFVDLPEIDDLDPGQAVGLLVTVSGELHLFLDGRHRKKIATGLPVHSPLWGVAHVYEKCTKIRSQNLSGKLA